MDALYKSLMVQQTQSPGPSEVAPGAEKYFEMPRAKPEQPSEMSENDVAADILQGLMERYMYSTERPKLPFEKDI